MKGFLHHHVLIKYYLHGAYNIKVFNLQVELENFILDCLHYLNYNDMRMFTDVTYSGILHRYFIVVVKSIIFRVTVEGI